MSAIESDYDTDPDRSAAWNPSWHAATAKDTNLVMIPLRMALWQRDREGHPTTPGVRKGIPKRAVRT